MVGCEGVYRLGHPVISRSTAPALTLLTRSSSCGYSLTNTITSNLKTRLPLGFGSRFQMYPFGKRRVDSLSTGGHSGKTKAVRIFQFCRGFHLTKICKAISAFSCPLKGYEGMLVLGGNIPMFLHHSSLRHLKSLLIMEERCGYNGSLTFLLFTLIPS